jgi:hypothetical protein
MRLAVGRDYRGCAFLRVRKRNSSDHSLPVRRQEQQLERCRT